MKIPYISINANVLEYPATEFEGDYETVYEPNINAPKEMESLLPIIDYIIHSWDESMWRNTSKMQYAMDCFLEEIANCGCIVEECFGVWTVNLMRLIKCAMTEWALANIPPGKIASCLIDKNGELLPEVKKCSAEFIEETNQWARSGGFNSAVEKYHTELVLQVARI